jgi:hypothetical protein
MVLFRAEATVDATVTTTNLLAALRNTIAAVGMQPISEFSAIRANAAGVTANHLVYQTEDPDIVFILSVRTGGTVVEACLGRGWDNATRRAANYSRDCTLHSANASLPVAIAVFKGATELIISTRQENATVGLFSYIQVQSPDWWDKSRFPSTYMFTSPSNMTLIPFDGTLNPYNVTNVSYGYSGNNLNFPNPGRSRDIIAGPLIDAPSGLGIAGKLPPFICRVAASSTICGDIEYKGALEATTEEYFILSQGTVAGLAARYK